MINLTCPNCAADLDLPEDRDVAFCSYCGKKILIGEHTKVSGQVTVDDAVAARRRAENYVALAERYGKRGDKEKLNLYIDKALEEDIGVGDKVDALEAKYWGVGIKEILRKFKEELKKILQESKEKLEKDKKFLQEPPFPLKGEKLEKVLQESKEGMLQKVLQKFNFKEEELKEILLQEFNLKEKELKKVLQEFKEEGLKEILQEFNLKEKDLKEALQEFKESLMNSAKEDKEYKKEDKEDKKENKEDKKEDEWTDCCGCIIAAIVIFCVAGSCCG